MPDSFDAALAFTWPWLIRVSAGRIVTDDLEIRGEALLRGGGQVDFGGKLALRVASPPDRVPRLQGFVTGDLTNPHLTILKAEF